MNWYIDSFHRKRGTDVYSHWFPEFYRFFRRQTTTKLRRLAKDIEIVHGRQWPGHPMSLTSILWLLVISPGLRLMLMHRIAYWSYLKRKNAGFFWQVLRVFLVPLKLVTKIDTKSYTSNTSKIEAGVCFSDQGYITFGPRKAGAGTVIGARVTVGMSHMDEGCPEIGRNVWIGSDCVVYGAISIGNGATLLPGTVLTKSIPAGVVMQGNPARLVSRDFDNSELRAHQNADAMQYVAAKRGG
jgi:serine acetyltransferase